MEIPRKLGMGAIRDARKDESNPIEQNYGTAVGVGRSVSPYSTCSNASTVTVKPGLDYSIP